MRSAAGCVVASVIIVSLQKGIAIITDCLLFLIQTSEQKSQRVDEGACMAFQS